MSQRKIRTNCRVAHGGTCEISEQGLTKRLGNEKEFNVNANMDLIAKESHQQHHLATK